MMIRQSENFTGPFLEIVTAARAALRAIPPAFPLEATVAVNPFLGQTGEGLAMTAARLGRAGGLSLTLPRASFAARLAKGEMTEADLTEALTADLTPDLTLADLKAALQTEAPPPQAVPTLADLAAQATGTDWPGIILERTGIWAASHFDMGQALWPAARGTSAWAAWRAFAAHDLTPEIAGLTGFAAHVAGAPDQAWPAIARAAARLGLAAPEAEGYFHTLLHSLGGWAQVGRWKLWQAELAGGSDDTLVDLLAIRLTWEEALMSLHGDRLAAPWAKARAVLAAPLAPTRDQRIDAVLQLAAELAGQRQLGATLAAPSPADAAGTRPALQAAFCIDVRSEVFRRALESTAPGIQTIGFAGFFGLPLSHRPFASVIEQAHLPVLLNAGMSSAPVAASAEAERAARIAARTTRAWGRFRQAAVSSFAFVEAAGPLYAGKLVRDALGLGLGSTAPEPLPQVVGLDLPTRIATAAAVLGAMSMRGPFAPQVILAGHGASVTNNPQASALHCGACGGQTGEISARVLAGVLNDPQVRAALPAQGFDIPADTRFIAALHDTTTDAVTLFDCDGIDVAQAGGWLAQAGLRARAERAGRLSRAAGGAAIAARATNWAEVRPEWGLAGCASFIAAPRHRTAGRDLKGRAFLHSYDWRADTGFGVLELILTAPVVVASWISLQYYGSVVAPQAFGAGNKLLHNVVGGFGVLEGNGGAPRVGLAWQSVHDGQALQHDPLRLTVVVEAPEAAMNDILARHDGVRALFDNGWLHLLSMDDEGHLAGRYSGNLGWARLGPVQALAA